MTDDRLVLNAGNTHLYRGARLSTGIPAGELGAEPRGLRIVFRDGNEVDAELLQNDDGDLAVEVPAYRTAAGTDLIAKVWRATAHETAEGAELAIGDHL